MKSKPLTLDYQGKNSSSVIRIPIDAFKKPETDKEYQVLQAILDKLIDEIRDNTKHPLQPALQIIGDNIEAYDDEHFPAIGDDVSDIELVKYLMASHGLRQQDLADIFGSQANVSKYLNGERSLSKKNIEGLKERFGISADFFIR